MTKGYSDAEWQFMRRLIEGRLSEHKPEDGAADHELIHSLKRSNLPLFKRVFTRPEMVNIARHLGFFIGTREGSKYGHIFWPKEAGHQRPAPGRRQRPV